MINLILYGAIAFCGLKIFKSGTTPSVANTRTGAPIGGSSGTVGVTVNTTGASGPSSGSKQVAGNANQPWYTGAVVAGAGVAAASLAKGLGSLMTQSSTPNDGPEVDDSDLEESQSEMATSSYSSNSDDEEAGDNSDEEYS